jgi:hypothetical protein
LDVRRAAAYEQLEFQIDDLVASRLLQMAAAPAPSPHNTAHAVVAPSAPYRQERAVDREPFGRWLLLQKNRGDAIDDLATAARADSGFPRNGTPDQVRARLRHCGADSEAFEQVNDAERFWSERR